MKTVSNRERPIQEYKFGRKGEKNEKMNKSRRKPTVKTGRPKEIV